MLSVLYRIIVLPIELCIGFVFAALYRLLGNCGTAILMVSLTVNLLILPLYRQADRAQEGERRKQEAMSAWVAHIRRTFRGDERFMMLAAYYRQQGYRPVYALRGSVSLLLQVPFFLAAYRYLSRLSLLQGASFWLISDLGAPDGLLRVGGVTIHLLPVLMTLVNLLSGYIYMRGFPLKSKLQTYLLAALFLALLYDSPSGLTLYWTMNNLFSLGKNLYDRKIRDKARARAFLCAGFGTMAYLCLALSGAFLSARRILLYTALLILSFLPLIYTVCIRGRNGGKAKKLLADMTERTPFAAGFSFTAVIPHKRLFICAGLLLTLLLGALIPSSVIADSPTEFIGLTENATPFTYIFGAFCVAAGLFLLWGGILYTTARERERCGITFLYWCAGVMGLVNYMLFGKGLGTISTDLHFDNEPVYTLASRAGNLLLLALLFFALLLLWKYTGATYRIALVLTCSVALLSLWQLGKTAYTPEMLSAGGKTSAEKEAAAAEGEPSPLFTLSTEGRNVVVIMLDRAINGFVPYLFHENPSLLAQFAGLTYYPNTVSFGGYTNFGAPALFGGYEYTPKRVNERANEPLVDKHDEALKVMPVLFSGEGFATTVCDPPYAGYRWVPELGIYADYPEISAYHTEGKYTSPYFKLSSETYEKKFFCYALFKALPVVLQTFAYDGGNYFISPDNTEFQHGTFLNAYSVLESLPLLTKIDDGKEDTFLMLTNNTTHDPCMLQLPDYVPYGRIDNDGLEDMSRFTVDGKSVHMDTTAQLIHYHANMAAFLQLGKWFDYLRENGAYDNTRILIVSDHGRELKQFDELLINDELDAERFNPLLMYKDFGAKEFTVSEEFMTNADTPMLAVKDVIENPVNPFTGKTLDNAAKYTERVEITLSDLWDVDDNNGNTFIDDGSAWYSVHDNIFEKENWERLR